MRNEMALEERYRPLTMRAQTAYSHLLDAALYAEHGRSAASLPGYFSKNEVKGKTYWYYRFTDVLGKPRRIYVGPDSPNVQALVQAKAKSPIDQDALRTCVKIAVASGCQATASLHFRVIRRLAEHGFFHAGGVLIGSHAFVGYSNMLGVHWGGDAAAMTNDIDFAHAGQNLSVALPADLQINTSNAIESLGMGFVPLIGAAAVGAGSWHVPATPEFTLDFVTPKTDIHGEAYRHEKLGILLQPLPFMEYSLQDVEQTVIFDTNSAVLVNVPNPARYALHKLIVYGERKGAHQLKARKDLQQAALLLRVLENLRPEEIDRAWRDLQSRGPGWRKRASLGLDALDRQWPDYHFKDRLATALINTSDRKDVFKGDEGYESS